MKPSPNAATWKGIALAVLMVLAVAGGVVALAGASSLHTPAELPSAAGGVADLRPGPSMYCAAVVPTGVARPDVGGAPTFEAYWDARRRYEYRAALVAPGEIAAAWRIVALHTRDVATPIVTAARFDPDSEPAEPAEVTAARRLIAEYDRTVC